MTPEDLRAHDSEIRNLLREMRSDLANALRETEGRLQQSLRDLEQRQLQQRAKSTEEVKECCRESLRQASQQQASRPEPQPAGWRSQDIIQWMAAIGAGISALILGLQAGFGG